MRNSGFLDPHELSLVANFKLRVRGTVEGFLVGAHKSPYHGFSAEFSEHRHYSPGDDLRWLDWKALARADKPFTKVFEEETNLRAYLLIDVSNSMSYEDKLAYAATLAGALGYLLFLQHDAVGLVPFSDGIHEVLPPRSSRTHLDEVLVRLARLTPQGKTSPRRAFLELAGHAKRRGLIILLSDLMAEPDEVVRAARAFRARKHHVLVFHILSPRETDSPPMPGLYQDLETGERVVYHPSTGGEAYARSFSRWKMALEAGLTDIGVEYHLFTTDTPLSVALAAFFSRRERLP